MSDVLELSCVDESQGEDEVDAGTGVDDEDSNAEDDTPFIFSNPVTTADEDGASKKPKTVQEKLKNVLKRIEEGREVEIQLLLAEGADVNHQYEEEHLKTPLHLLCNAFDLVNEDEDFFEPFAAMTQTLLDAGGNVNIVDSDGDTVLHVAADAGAPADVLKEIIKRTEKVNQYNSMGEQALHRLFASTGTRTHEGLEALIRAGANLEAMANELVSADSPLPALASRKDCVSLMSTIDRLKPGQLDRHVPSMLKPAVEDGTFETVKTLLDRGASVDVEGDPLILIAAESSEEALKKFDLLLAAGCDIHAVDDEGENVFHRAAGVDNIGVMKKAWDMKVDHNKASGSGELPIHRCAGDDDSKCFNFLVQIGCQLDVKNSDGESPLFLAVQDQAKKNIALLVKSGCSVRDKKLKYLAFDNISALAEPEVITGSSAPVTCALELTEVFKKCAARNEAHGQHLLEMADDMEQLAVDILQASDWYAEDVITDDVIFYALDNDLKKFIASAAVQEQLKDLWYADYTATTLKKREYLIKVTTYLLKMLFLPFLMIVMLPRHGCYYKQFADQFLEGQVEPVIAFIANAISYVAFVAVLITSVILNSEGTRCDNLMDGTGCGLNALDWIVFIFVLGLIVQEVSQFSKVEFSEYISSFSNIFDLILMLLFVIYYLLAFIGFYSDADIDVRYQLVRASYHVLGFAALISCTRFLSYLQAHPVLGPIQLSFVGITSDVALFLIILGTFLVGFAVSVTSVFSARLYSPGPPGNATEPFYVDNFWISLKTMFWALFGFTDDTFFKDGTDEEESAEVVVGTVLFALWLIISIIVLLNMLIALISNSFQKVQDNADIEWKFARATIIRDITKAPPIPVPMNLIHTFAKVVSHLCCRRCTYCMADDDDESEMVSIGAVIRCSNTLLVEKFKDKVAAEREEKPVTKADLKKLRSRIDASFRTVLSCVAKSPTKSTSHGPSFDFDESDSEEEAYISFFRRHLQASRRPRSSSVTKEAESEEPAQKDSVPRKKSVRDKTSKVEERDVTQPAMSSDEEVRRAGPSVVGGSTLETLITKIETNLKAFDELKSDIGARLDAFESRLDGK